MIIPGGDTIRIANSFTEMGLQLLSKLISMGAIYIGICAGAYLPLRSSIHPLSKFNLVNLKIANISMALPESLSDAERYSISYGCGYIFHPARGPVKLEGERTLIAPLYGGPMIRSDKSEAKAKLMFGDLLESSEILVDRELCKKTMVGTAACVESKYHEGRLILISPHLEHPDYPVANWYFADLISKLNSTHHAESEDGGNPENSIELRKIIADLRVSAAGLQERSWKIGVKYWDSEKLLFFIDAVRKRLEDLRRTRHAIYTNYETLNLFKSALEILRRSSKEQADIEEIVKTLSEGTSYFLNNYFSQKMLGVS